MNNVDTGSTDNCAISLSISPTSFTCADLGVKSVTLTGSNTGPVGTCATPVTVIDDIKPVARCKVQYIYQKDAVIWNIT